MYLGITISKDDSLVNGVGERMKHCSRKVSEALNAVLRNTNTSSEVKKSLHDAYYCLPWCVNVKDGHCWRDKSQSVRGGNGLEVRVCGLTGRVRWSSVRVRR